MIKSAKYWGEKFFSGLWNDVQVKMFSEAQTLEHVKFIIDILKLKRKDKVLDIPCGEGRISNVLAKKGMEITGVDINPVMLKRALQFTKANKLKSKFIKKNMWDIDFENEFDAALCFWGSFGYFSDEVNRKFLEKVFKALKPGGRFLVDMHTVETLLSVFQPNGWFKAGDIYVTEYRTYDVFNSRINSDWTLIKKGKTENKTVSIRLYSYKELINILQDIGFKPVKSYGTIHKDEFNKGSRRLYLVVKK